MVRQLVPRGIPSALGCEGMHSSLVRRTPAAAQNCCDAGLASNVIFVVVVFLLSPWTVNAFLPAQDCTFQLYVSCLPLVLFSRWEQRELPNGRVYYVDHNTKTTTWERPLPPG